MKMIVAVIPAYNEASVIAEVLERVKTVSARSEARIVPLVVNDGSTDATEAVARTHGALTVSHLINRGLGAALSTGITAAHQLLLSAGMTDGGAIVTFDADGQHDPAELHAVAAPILSGEADVVLGSRFKAIDAGSMPTHRSIANRMANFCTGLLFGVWVSDTQSGYRAFSYRAATELKIRTSTMEVSSEIVREIGRNQWRLMEVPITVAYTQYSLSKGQSFTKGIETLWKLIVLRFFR